MDHPTGTILRIGAWRLNVAASELSKPGSTVRLDPRLMRLLLCLAERPGEIVSTDALLKAVWSEVVVTPDSVYQAVASLRRSLGDDPKKPEYIATIARVGYRLIAPVGPDNTAEMPAIELEPARPAASRLRGRSRRVVFAAIALAAVIVTAVATFVGQQRTVEAAQTIAVLPFLDLTSQSMDQEYFADGITEELIGELSRLQGIRVSSPSASFHYKNKDLPPSEIGTALGVRYLLDGSVRRSGATLRVTARLLRASDGFVIWTETFERDPQDPLKVQDNIAQAVSERVRSSLADGA